MKINMGFAACDEWGMDVLNNAFEDILLDEIVDKTIYDSRGDEAVNEAYADWEKNNTATFVILQNEGEQ